MCGNHDTVDDDRLFRDCPIEHNRWNMDIWSAALIVAMVYLDKKIVMVTNGIALVSIVVHLVRCFLGDGSDLQNNVIGLFVLLLTAYACNRCRASARVFL